MAPLDGKRHAPLAALIGPKLAAKNTQAAGECRECPAHHSYLNRSHRRIDLAPVGRPTTTKRGLLLRKSTRRFVPTEHFEHSRTMPPRQRQKANATSPSEQCETVRPPPRPFFDSSNGGVQLTPSQSCGDDRRFVLTACSCSRNRLQCVHSLTEHLHLSLL